MRMRLRVLAPLAVAVQLLSCAHAYLTTVEISLTYCPAPSLTLASGTGNITPTSGPGVKYLLYVQQGASGPSQYVSNTGTVVLDAQEAQIYIISPSGQLMSGGSYFSTSGLVPFEAFTPRSYAAAVSTTFSNQNNILVWTSNSFALGQAQFCLMGTTLEVAYDGYLPAGCVAVNVYLEAPSTITTTMSIISPSASSITVSSVPTQPSGLGTVHGKLVSGDPVGCLTSPSSAPTLGGISETVSTLEQCADFCETYYYFGVQNGNNCVCGNTLGTNASPASYGSCNLQCSGNSTEICGGVSAMAVYAVIGRIGSGSSASVAASSTATISLYPSPTSTGLPNCYDRSPFDGTVNGGYLILCDTDLPGYDLEPFDGSDLADCISACSSYVPSGAGQCVAVEYDVQADYNACVLKSNISAINRGDNQFAQAAILVNEPYSPNIQFEDQTNPSSNVSASSNTIVTTSIASSSTMQSSPILVGSTSSSTAATSAAPALTSTSFSNNSVTSSSAAHASISPQVTSSSSSSTVATSTIASSSSSSATGCLAQPTGTLCPAYTGQTVNQAGFCYNIECTASLIGNVLTGNSTTANSLSNCNGFCNLYNLALPFGCVGVNYLNTAQPQGQLNCFLLSTIANLIYTSGTDSGSLIYSGYVPRQISGAPTPSVYSSSTSSTLSTSSAVSSPSSSLSSSTSSLPLSLGPTSSSSAVVRTSSSSTSSSSTSLAPSCAASYAPGPTMGSLCTSPSYSRQGLSYDSYGTTENYEIECGTVFTGTALAASVAFDLPDCIKFCQYDNQYTAASCKAVMFNNTAAAVPPINNCFPFASLSGLTRGSTIFDGARLLYSGYPCITDYDAGYTFS